MINILIPMAGLGSRFREVGVSIPKYNIDIFGKTMIERATDSFISEESRFIFITLNSDDKTVEKLNSIGKDSVVLDISELTDGSVSSCLVAKEYINNNEELLITNCDQILYWNFQDFLSYCRVLDTEGVIVTYESSEEKNSYAKIDNKGNIIEVKEKEIISNLALNGVHYWKSGSLFVKSAEEMIKNEDRNINGEYSVGPTYNYLIRRGNKVKNFHLSSSQNHLIGTPKDLKIFMEGWCYGNL
tara:strand:+ start:25584 stop:26312 length:729 start_codon:yes stop_codon:yes gene_type:complete